MGIVSNIQFFPVRKRVAGHIGFVNFHYEEGMAIKDVAVHERLDKKGYRLVYPNVKNKEGDVRSVVFPNNRDTQEQIDREINAYLRSREIESEDV